MAAVEDHIVRWLLDLHAVEQQALFQLRGARRLVDPGPLADHLDAHVTETLRHRRAVRERLDAYGRSPSAVLDVAVTANRVGFLLYTAASPDAPGKLVVDSFAYEFLEIAAYRMLAHAARRAGDEATADTADTIAADERTMAARLAGRFDWAVQASRGRARGEVGTGLRAHVRDAHALEVQSAVLLSLAGRVAGDPRLAAHYRRRAELAHRRRAVIVRRLRELGTRPAVGKTVGMGAGGAAWALLWASQRDTPAKLAAFAYAAEHLLIASYELLAREAALAADASTEELARARLAEGRDAARELFDLVDRAADAALGDAATAATAALSR